MTSRQKVISIGLTAVLLIGLAVGVVLVQRQQILKSKASQEIYNAFAVRSGDSEHYVRCTGNVCETNTLSITMSVRDLTALEVKEEVASAAKTPEQCRQELGTPGPICDLGSCIKNEAVVKDNECSFEPKTVDLSLCPNNCQVTGGTQAILCREFEICQKDKSSQLTGNLIKYWVNDLGGTDGCQVQEQSVDADKCPTGQALPPGQYTSAGGGLTGQTSTGLLAPAFCSAQDYSTACWQGSQCKEENQGNADKACSNNHGQGSKCTRSTGQPDVFEDGCTTPPAISSADINKCSAQYYVTACWQGADCKEENQASADSTCNQNHGTGSVCMRSTGQSNAHEDGCTFGTNDQAGASAKANCTSEAYATTCWQGARCDETNQKNADNTCTNNHGPGSKCTRSTGQAGTSEDGCTVTVLDIAKARQALKSAAAPAPDCEDIYSCSEDITAELIIEDSCGEKASRSVFDPKSCAPDLDVNQAIDLNMESKRLAKLKQQQEEQKKEKPFWEKAGDMAGGLWNGIISLGKGVQEAPTLSEVGQANWQVFSKNIQSFLGENQRKAEQVNASPECQNALTLVQAGVSVEAELLKSCFGSVGTQKNIEEKPEEAEACTLESGDVKTCLRKTGVNMDVGEAKIAKTGICIPNIFTIIANSCVGFTGESVVPADASQNLSEVMRKAEVVKLAESLGFDLEKDDPKNWEAAKRKFFFKAAARTDINASKYMAEFLGIPITAWENANEAAKICARDFNKLCFTNSETIPMGAVMSLRTNEDFEKINQIAQSLYRGFVPASNDETKKLADLISRYGSTNNAYFSLKPEQLPKPSDIPQEEWDRIIRTAKVYAQVGDYVKNNTVAGRLYNEKQSEAILDTYIGLASTVVDPFPAAQALVSGLKYVVVKQVYKRLSERFGSKVASEIVQNAETAIARGAAVTTAERNAVNIVEGEVVRILDEEGLEIPVRSTGNSLSTIVQYGTEPPPAVQAIADARVSPEVEQTALQALKDSHSVSAADLDGQRVVIPDREAGFVAPEPTNPIRAAQDGINGLVDDVESLLNRGPPAPAVEVAERAAEPHSNPVLARVAETGEKEAAPLGAVADHLDETASRVGVEPSAREPNPAEGILVDGRDRAAGVINEVKETVDAVGKEVDRFVHGPAIEDARSIDELYQAIQARGNIQGSQKSYTPDELIYLIEGVRSGDRQLNYITSKGGLRDKVGELVEEEVRAAQKTIQTEIETRNYAAAVNVVDPPKPVRSNRIDPEKAKQWVASHDTPEARRAAQAIVDNTRHISQEEFEAGLRRSVKSLNESLPAGEDYTVLIQNRKSNKWVTELALPQMDSLPSQVIDIGNISAVGLTKSKRFVFFDDAIYSGSQMRLNVQNLFMTLNQRGVDMSGITIHVISPYATNYGKTEILGLLSGTAFRDAKIVFGSHEFLPSVAEAIGDPQIISSIQKMYKHGAERRTLTYFDHKIPDGVSTYNEPLTRGDIKDLNGVSKGYLRFIPETHSPYHGVSSQQAALSELEQKMKVSGQKKYLVSSIPEVGPQIEKQVYFVKTGEGDLVALKSGYGSEVIPTGQIRRGDEIIPLNNKPFVKLKKGDEIILGSATLSPTTDGSVEYHLFYDGEKLVKDIPLPETAGKYPAPCPIVSLIPVALAQEPGGVSPCPRKPLAALARNAGNAFKQAGDGVGGIFDRFRGIKAQSELDQIVPATSSERAILNKAKILEAVTDKDIALLNKAGAEVAQQAQNFDYVIVSGHSADISETILRKQGVSQDKIIKFSVEDNGNVYKIVEGQATQLREAERNTLTREALEKKGVNLAGDKKPTFLIVDDISDTGYKATAYLDRFSQIEGVGETQYAALTALRGAVIDPSSAGTGNFVNLSRERLEELAQKTFAPSKLKPAEKSRVAYVLDNLSGVLEWNTQRNDTISYNVLVRSRVVAKDVLGRISKQTKNPIQTTLDNVGSAVQNTGKQLWEKAGGVFKRESELKIPANVSPAYRKTIEETYQNLHEIYPDIKFEVFSTQGSSAVIYIDKKNPGVVYKAYRDMSGEGESLIDGKINTARSAEQEAKKLQILSQEGLAPQLIEYIPPSLTDEESKLLRDSSFGFYQPENSVVEATSLPPARRVGKESIVAMDKVDVDPQGFAKLAKDPVKKQAVIDRVVAVLERLQFIPLDTEMVVDKSGRLMFIDLTGMTPLYKGSPYEGWSIREAVEEKFDQWFSNELRQEQKKNIFQKAGDTVGGWVDNFRGIFQKGGKEEAEVVIDRQIANVNKAEKALKKGKVTPELEEFWGSLVRDTEGRFAKYTDPTSDNYFDFLDVPGKLDLTNKNTRDYLIHSIQARVKFLEGLKESRQNVESLDQFRTWLQEIHQEQAYKGTGGKIRTREDSAITVAAIAKGDLQEIAAIQGDKYLTFVQYPAVYEHSYQVKLRGISEEARPIQVEAGGNITHQYPKPQYFDEYLKQMQESLQGLKLLGREAPLDDQLRLVGQMYQYGVNTRMFEASNNSLFMNMVNGLLIQRGLKPIEHGILDFAAFSLSTENFVEYFIDEVYRTQAKALRQTPDISLLGRVRSVFSKPYPPKEQTEKAYAMLTEKRTRTVRLGDTDVYVTFGFDPEIKNQARGGLTDFIEPSQKVSRNIKILSKDGKVIDLSRTQSPVMVDDIERIFIDNAGYKLGNDAWLNPILYQEVEVIPNPQFIKVGNDIKATWEAALESPEKLDLVLRSVLPTEKYQEIKAMVEYLKKHPDLQILKEKRVDLFDLAALSEEKAENFVLSHMSSVPVDSLTYRHIIEVIAKIRQNVNLSQDDLALIAALRDREVAILPSIYRVEPRAVNELTEGFALANLAEDYLAKSIVPEAGFALHSQNYQQFIDMMKARGMQIPDWFTPFSQNEFRFGIQLTGTKANAAGQYFISRELDTAESVAIVINHERIHILTSMASELGSKGAVNSIEGLLWADETFTEALTLLIKHQGNVKQALAENALGSSSNYFTGVEKLLRVVQEINQRSGDNLLGTELLLKGIIEQADGKIVRTLEPIENYYNQYLARSGQPFEAIMSPFANTRRPYFSFAPPPAKDLPKDNIVRTLESINFDDDIPQSVKDLYGSPQYSFLEALQGGSDRAIFLTSLQKVINDPLHLISTISHDELDEIFLQAILRNPQARKEFEGLIADYYQDYAKALGIKLEDAVQKQGVRQNVKLPSKTHLEQVGDTLQNWFNGIFNAGKKQSMSLEVAWA